MNNEIAPMLGQLTTLITLIAANPNINEQTKLEAHHLLTYSQEWMQGKIPKDTLISRIDQLTQDIRLLLR